MTSPLVGRRERIVFLLDHWADIHGPGYSDKSTGQVDPLGHELTSSMADHPSVVELARCLTLLAQKLPRHHLHLSLYFGAFRVVQVPKRTGSGKTLMRVDEFGHRVPVLEPRRVRSYPAWLDAEPQDAETGEPRLVAHGVDMLSALFRGEVFIPNQLREAGGLTRAA